MTGEAHSSRNSGVWHWQERPEETHSWQGAADVIMCNEREVDVTWQWAPLELAARVAPLKLVPGMSVARVEPLELAGGIDTG